MRYAIPLVVALSASSVAQQAPWWTGTWSEAWAAAEARNVPVLLCFNLDNEEANERALALYRQAGFVDLCDDVIPIICSPSSHKEATRRTSGRKKPSTCRRFGHVSCSHHRRIEREARLLVFGVKAMHAEKSVPVPSHYLFTPDKKLVWEDFGDVPAAGLISQAIKKAQRKLGRGLTAKQYEEIQSGLEKAKAALGEGRLADTVKELEKLAKVTKGTPYAKACHECEKALDEHIAAVLSQAKDLHAGGDVIGALRMVGQTRDALGRTSRARTVKRALSKMSRTREGRAALRVLAKEEKARPFLADAREAERAGEWIKAVRLYGVVKTRAADTPLADLAQRRLDELSRDKDIAPLIEAEKRKADAADALRDARRLLRTDKEAGRRALQRIIERYEGTPAARKAKRQLGSRG